VLLPSSVLVSSAPCSIAPVSELSTLMRTETRSGYTAGDHLHVQPIRQDASGFPSRSHNAFRHRNRCHSLLQARAREVQEQIANELHCLFLLSAIRARDFPKKQTGAGKAHKAD
jgi:hypothetical protein